MTSDGKVHPFLYDPTGGIQDIAPSTELPDYFLVSIQESGTIFPSSTPLCTIPSTAGWWSLPWVEVAAISRDFPVQGILSVGRRMRLVHPGRSSIIPVLGSKRCQLKQSRFACHHQVALALPSVDRANAEPCGGVTDDGVAIGYSVAPFVYNPHRVSSENPVTRSLSLGGSWSYAYASNRKGQVVGQAVNESGVAQAFLYDPVGGMRTLSLGGTQGSAYGINEQGQVIGWSLDTQGDVQAFVYDATDGIRPLSLGGRFGHATRINAAGQVTGVSENAAGERQAFLYDPETGMQTLTLGGGSGLAYDINGNGQVTGWSQDASGVVQAFLFDPSQGIQPLSLGGSWGFGYRINASGQVIGRSQNLLGDTQAFVFDPITGMLELSFGGSWSDATAINEAGQVVGYAQTAGGETHAFLYDPTQGLEDLNDVVSDPKGFLLQIARFINEKGEILAEGNNAEDSAQNKYQPLLIQLEEAP